MALAQASEAEAAERQAARKGRELLALAGTGVSTAAEHAALEDDATEHCYSEPCSATEQAWSERTECLIGDETAMCLR